MSKKRIAILGCTGLLGSTVSRYLSLNDKLELILFCRDIERGYNFARTLKNDPQCFFISDYLGHMENGWSGMEFDWTINCIGVTKGEIDESNWESRMNCIEWNGLFPFRLAKNHRGGQIIHFLTDCEYAGDNAPYNEKSIQDANDLYGITKALGQPECENLINLRASIIGPELFSRKRSLFGWFISQPKNAVLNGYTNVFWNGIASLQYAKIIENIILNDLHLQIPNKINIIPDNNISKYELLNLFKKYSGRNDITIKEANAQTPIDRRLSTIYPSSNQLVWGKNGIKTIEEMVKEMCEFQKNE